MSAVDAVIHRYVVESFGEDFPAEEIAIAPVRAGIEALKRHVVAILSALDDPTAPKSVSILKAAGSFKEPSNLPIDDLLFNARDIGDALEFLPHGVAGVVAHFRGRRRRQKEKDTAQCAEREAYRKKVTAEALADPVAWLWRQHARYLPINEDEINRAAVDALTEEQRDELARRYRALLAPSPPKLAVLRPKAGRRTARTLAKKPKVARHA